MKKLNQSFLDLVELGIVREESTAAFHAGTRDDPIAEVYWDTHTKVIFIKEGAVAKKAYESGEYRKDGEGRDVEIGHIRYLDLKRRALWLERYCIGKKIIDFGCGHGDFLIKMKGLAANMIGIELQESLIELVNFHGIRCHSNTSCLEDEWADNILMFHVLEHLEKPLEGLRECLRLLRPGGLIAIEVPSANDLLLEISEGFVRHTLWRQHLVLHTRMSLELFLKSVGFVDVQIQGVQRYGLGNHIAWCKEGIPTGNNGKFSSMDQSEMTRHYEAMLASNDKTDTYIALARKPQ